MGKLSALIDKYTEANELLFFSRISRAKVYLARELWGAVKKVWKLWLLVRLNVRALIKAKGVTGWEVILI